MSDGKVARNRSVLRAIGTLVALAAIAPAGAQKPYKTGKKFTITVASAAAPSVEGKYVEWVWTEEPLDGHLFRCNSDPVAVGACSKDPPPFGTVPVGPTGLPSKTFMTLLLPVPNTDTARTTIAVDPFKDNKDGTWTITGSVDVDGNAVAVAPAGTTKSNAFAASEGHVGVRGFDMVKGKLELRLGTALAYARGGSVGEVVAGRNSAKDPVAFAVTDLVTGLTSTGSLFDMLAELRGPGTIDWDAETGAFALDASDPSSVFDLMLDASSPYTTQHGRVDLQVRGGLVTRSVATGTFASFAPPPVGSVASFAGVLPAVVLDFDLSPLRQHASIVSLSLAQEGTALDTKINPVPEPSTTLLTATALAVAGAVARRRARRRPDGAPA